MSANDYYANTNSSSGPGHQQPSFDTQQTSNQQHSSHSYAPQGQTHLHSYDNHHRLHQDHAAGGRRRSSAISTPAGAADVSLHSHLAQGSVHHKVPNNIPANHGGTSSVQHGHPKTSHFCPVGQNSTTTSHGPNSSDGHNGPSDMDAPNTPNGPDAPDGKRGLGATLVGGASGHFLAHQLGHGHHHGVLGSTAGAVAANFLEHKLKKKNHDQIGHHHHQQNQHAHDLGHRGGGLSGMFGGGGGGGRQNTLQQQAQQHHYPETHAGSVRGGYEQLGYGSGYGHGKQGKWGH